MNDSAAVVASEAIVILKEERDAARRTATLLASGLMALRGEVAKLRAGSYALPHELALGYQRALVDVLALLDEIDRRAIETPDPGEVTA